MNDIDGFVVDRLLRMVVDWLLLLLFDVGFREARKGHSLLFDQPIKITTANYVSCNRSRVAAQSRYLPLKYKPFAEHPLKIV